jgi:putative endonuclease
MHDRALLGRRGEKRAERYLRRIGYRIVTRNYSCPAGEIDLVALDRETIVFIEIKTRTDDDAEQAFRAITPAKKRHMINAARYFLQHTHRQNHPCRFDVVAVLRDESNRLIVEHAPDAVTIRG